MLIIYIAMYFHWYNIKGGAVPEPLNIIWMDCDINIKYLHQIYYKICFFVFMGVENVIYKSKKYIDTSLKSGFTILNHFTVLPVKLELLLEIFIFVKGFQHPDHVCIRKL